MYFQLNMVIFHYYVSLPEGIIPLTFWPLVMSVPHSPNTLLACHANPMAEQTPSTTTVEKTAQSGWKKSMEKHMHIPVKHNAFACARGPIQNLSHKGVRFRFWNLLRIIDTCKEVVLHSSCMYSTLLHPINKSNFET